ncbi:DUF2586 family protein [Bacteroides uniformis]|nr:DUF2586 family protein [Bacteroides uniformis]
MGQAVQSLRGRFPGNRVGVRGHQPRRGRGELPQPPNRYESLSPSLLDELDDKGYIFPIKYAGRENGIYISKDQTCSHGDFRTIARNRTINKSRRAVRAALLPYVNSPLMVNPSTGFLAPSKITAFKTLIGDILAKMQAAQEISRIRRHYRPEPERVGGRHAAHLLCPCPGGRGREDLCRGRTVINRK